MVMLIRGDDYAVRRPFDQLAFVTAALTPFDLSGCTLLTTWKVAATDPATDPDDTSAVFTGALVVGGDGTPTVEDGIYLVGDAAEGTVEVRVFKADTLALPLDQQWIFDYQLTDVDGETETWLYDGTADLIAARDGVTNRQGVS